MLWAQLLFGLSLLIGFVLLIVPGIILLVRGSLFEAVVVRERLTGFAAIQRSFELTKGCFWRLVGWSIASSFLAFLASLPLFFASLIPFLDWWLPDGVLTACSDIVLAYLTVFIWVMFDYFQAEWERQRNEPVPPPLPGSSVPEY